MRLRQAAATALAKHRAALARVVAQDAQEMGRRLSKVIKDNLHWDVKAHCGTVELEGFTLRLVIHTDMSGLPQIGLESFDDLVLEGVCPFCRQRAVSEPITALWRLGKELESFKPTPSHDCSLCLP